MPRIAGKPQAPSTPTHPEHSWGCDHPLGKSGGLFSHPSTRRGCNNPATPTIHQDLSLLTDSPLGVGGGGGEKGPIQGTHPTLCPTNVSARGTSRQPMTHFSVVKTAGRQRWDFKFPAGTWVALLPHTLLPARGQCTCHPAGPGNLSKPGSFFGPQSPSEETSNRIQNRPSGGWPRRQLRRCTAARD